MATFIIAIISIALFILGLSITLMRKGRHIQGDVGDNDAMCKLGLECSVRTALMEEAALRGETVDPTTLGCQTGICQTCESNQCPTPQPQKPQKS
ncbi:hypothetical protein BN938_1273 [Mucinivorans hirudinis]|uniref:Uncharacterized protein n=1 Tax=Mucinivorans hirudinis TaxID=1433126 RepID=A0A060R7R3_9BACT|nr:hypothetical protein BN938_1273 [Mucinivorans hirudinis]